MKARLFVGTSGWSYKEWAGCFYPKDLARTGELEYYAQHFDTVEINATFYRLPQVSMVKGWHRRSPADFIFAVKGSRFITHIKRLKTGKLALKRYFARVKFLKEKCGPVLWQLPPNFDVKNLKRLDTFLGQLPREYRHAVEFRHPSWYENKSTFDVLRRHNAAHVAISSLRMPMNETVTTDFVYVRFHGLEGGAYHDYTRRELKPWADFSRRSLRAGREVYAYFNNDLNTRAPLNAKVFRELVQGKKSQKARTRD